MPLLKIINKKKFNYGIWKITESVEELLNKADFNNIEIKYFEKFKNLDRKKQSITSRLILNELSNKKVNVCYNKNGAPVSNEIKNISISHSNKLSVALISDNLVGIDIQKKSEKIQIIQKKFIAKNDSNKSFNDSYFLHYIWCSKEAIFKTLNGLPCSFKKNIFLKNLTEKKSLGHYQSVNKKLKFIIYHEMFEDYFISIAYKN